MVRERAVLQNCERYNIRGVDIRPQRGGLAGPQRDLVFTAHSGCPNSAGGYSILCAVFVTFYFPMSGRGRRGRTAETLTGVWKLLQNWHTGPRAAVVARR